MQKSRLSSHTGILTRVASVGALKAVPVGAPASSIWLPQRLGPQVQMLRLLLQTKHILFYEFLLVLLLFLCNAQPNSLVCGSTTTAASPKSATHAAAMPAAGLPLCVCTSLCHQLKQVPCLGATAKGAIQVEQMLLKPL